MEMWIPLAVFAFVSSITPGPNNIMLSASGTAFGFRRTVPHLFGVWIGFALLLALCGIGVGALIANFSFLDASLRVMGSIYLLYFSWAIRDAFSIGEFSDRGGRPLKLLEGVTFQFINPKAWVMATTAISVFDLNLEPSWLAPVVVCTIFSIVNLPCICGWAAFGASIKPWLTNERRRQALSAFVAVLLLFSVIALWL